jgi:hypothetical protein
VAEIQKNPKVTALQLKVGTSGFSFTCRMQFQTGINLAFLSQIGNPSSTDNQFENVEGIHKSLGNANHLRYYTRKIKHEIEEEPKHKGTSGGDKFLFDMFQWDQ